MTYVKYRNKYTSRKLQENDLNIYIKKCHLMLLVALARVYCPYVLVILKLISSEKNILSAMTKIFQNDVPIAFNLVTTKMTGSVLQLWVCSGLIITSLKFP